jgi:hypothetical protein
MAWLLEDRNRAKILCTLYIECENNIIFCTAGGLSMKCKMACEEDLDYDGHCRRV